MHTIFKSKTKFIRYNKVAAQLSGAFILKISILIILLGLLGTSNQLCAQEEPEGVHLDTIPESMITHSAKKATIMSMILPGLGQAYNKKYWKIPIIYAGFGTLFYFIKKNGTEYRNFRTAYDIVYAGDSANYNNEYVVRYDANINQLEEGRNYYRRNLELSYVFTALLYILQVIDASVDANLYSFDVSDDLSLRFEPIVDPYMTAWKPAPAFKLKLRF